MGKDDFLQMWIFGESEEERRIGAILSNAMRMQAHAEGDFSNFSLYIAPVPKEELLGLYARRVAALAKYHEGMKAYEAANPQTENNILEFYKEMNDALGPEYIGALEEVRAIDSLLSTEKHKILDYAGSRLKELMYTLRSLTLIDMAFRNLSQAEEALQGARIPEIGNRVEELFVELNGILAEYRQNPSDKKVCQKLEALDNAFVDRVVVPLRDSHGIKIRQLYDLFYGRMGSGYINGFDWFIKQIEQKLEMPQEKRMWFTGIGFTLEGLLDGSYRVDTEPRLQFVEVGTKDRLFLNLFSPVQFEIQLPEKYSEVVRPVFESVKQAYQGRIVESHELQEFR